MTNKLFIKNMVCDRCKAAVKNELDKNKIAYHHIDLGEIELSESPSENHSSRSENQSKHWVLN